jgi:hypothetical protein
MKHFFVVLLSIALIACESPRARREDYLSKHSDYIDNNQSHLNNTAQDMIREGYLFKGMTKEQVEATWGSACWSCTGTTKNENGETWEYPTQILYFDKEGLLLRWTAK